VDYVDRTEPELRQELARVQQAVSDGARMLTPILRIRNPVIVSAYTQLRYVLQSLPPDAPPEQMADEIARLSYVMEQTVELLDTLSNSRVNNLQEARFTLTYGRAPKKRDPSVFKKHEQSTGDEPDEFVVEDDAGGDPADE
jgi:hypothetical protein